MIGFEYQLFTAQPPLYVIRKVQRTSQKEGKLGLIKKSFSSCSETYIIEFSVIPMSYYYILHGVVYQAPDLMSVISARLQMASHYLEEGLENGNLIYIFIISTLQLLKLVCF